MTKADKEGQRKAPILRFKGFTDAWEQRQLGEVSQLNGRIGFRGYTAKDIISKESGGILTFSPTNIINNLLEVKGSNTYITREKYEESPEIQVNNSDILFVKTGSTLGKSALVSGLMEPATINPQIVIIRSQRKWIQFLSVLLMTSCIQKQITAAKIGGAVPTLTESEIKKFKFYIPNDLNETGKIGQFFSKIDSLIALYERKIKALKKLKQAIFEVLNSIPHKSNVYRISEIFDVTRGNVLSKKSISNKFSNMYPVYSSQTKNDGLLGYYSDYLFENSITWTTDGANAGTVKYRTGKFYCTNVCGVLLNSEGYCNEYTAEVIEKETPKFVSHVGNPKLMNNVMKQIKIKLPDVATQQSYSDILLTFDNVCTSFCNKLNDLNQIKNKLLNTMFI